MVFFKFFFIDLFMLVVGINVGDIDNERGCLVEEIFWIFFSLLFFLVVRIRVVSLFLGIVIMSFLFVG